MTDLKGLPAASNRAERYGVSHHRDQGLSSGDGRVEQLVVWQETVVEVLGRILHQLLFAFDGGLLVLAGVPRPHRAEEQHPELFTCKETFIYLFIFYRNASIQQKHLGLATEKTFNFVFINSGTKQD